MVREPVVAGQFYPGRKEDLINELDTLIPECAEKLDALGVIVPHAGYMYSGQVAGEVYSRIRPKDTYILIGPNHTGMGGRFSVSSESWKTPIGQIDVDEELLAAIFANTDLLSDDPMSHSREHSLEVQVPFIQKISSGGALIVPISVKCGTKEEYHEIAYALYSAIENTHRDAVIIASSDMTHYEPREIASRKDRKAIEKIQGLDAEGLLDIVEEENITMCGYIPSAIMLMCSRLMGAGDSELIRYTDSGVMTGDISQVVGYAGIVVY